jgi:hypothetical protein
VSLLKNEDLFFCLGSTNVVLEAANLVIDHNRSRLYVIMKEFFFDKYLF